MPQKGIRVDQRQFERNQIEAIESPHLLHDLVLTGSCQQRGGILILQQLARRQPVKNRSRLLRSEDHTAAGRCQLKQIIKIFCLI